MQEWYNSCAKSLGEAYQRRKEMRLEGKTAIIIGAGQSPGEGLGNGRATALRFAQEGARIMAVDRNLGSAEETVALIRRDGGEATAFEADVTRETELKAAIGAAKQIWGHIDILHYNVGVSLGGGDTTLLDFTEEIFDRVIAINLRGAIMACKQVIPIMRQQGGGAIVMISSLAAIEDYPYVAYKASKAAMNAFTKQVAIQNAEYGIRANVILPGLMDTPMAIGMRVQLSGKSREEIAAGRDARVPLKHKMGTAWDVANAALFLASDEAKHITGAELLVDGGRSLMVG
jgi:NAD(P)-dependent dehydrogenase (short-subunit alcohol dehydrogenase family)